MKAGIYYGTAFEAFLSENKKSEQIAVGLEVVEAESAENKDCVGERVTGYLFFGEKSLRTTIETLRELGWKGDDLSDLSSCLNSGRVKFEVYSDTDLEGNAKLSVRFGGGVAAKPMEVDKQRAFAASMKAKIAAMSGGGGAPANANAGRKIAV